MELKDILNIQQEQIRALSEKVYDLTRDNTRNVLQRRNQVTDLYGIPFKILPEYNGAYMSISQDYVTLQRFQFKLIVNKKGSAKSLVIKLNNVNITSYLIKQMPGDTIVEKIKNWQNIGVGIYPGKDVDDGSMFDLLEVASDIIESGDIEKHDALLQPGLKKFEISWGDGYDCDIVIYIKYPNVNR